MEQNINKQNKRKQRMGQKAVGVNIILKQTDKIMKREYGVIIVKENGKWTKKFGVLIAKYTKFTKYTKNHDSRKIK